MFYLDAILETSVGKKGACGAEDFTWVEFKDLSMAILKGKPRAANARRNLQHQQQDQPADYGDDQRDVINENR